jgi:hypothetical protein
LHRGERCLIFLIVVILRFTIIKFFTEFRVQDPKQTKVALFYVFSHDIKERKYVNDAINLGLVHRLPGIDWEFDSFLLVNDALGLVL